MIDEQAVSRILQTLKLPILDIELCRNDYKGDANLTESQMCAGGIKGKDSCTGDSGGPLMKIEALNDEPPRYYLIGIVSFGMEECGLHTRPGVYTKMTKYIDWILEHAENDSP